MTGSLRKRGNDTWQLRVYLGIDADTGKQRWSTTTVHGTKRYATARLAEFAEAADSAKLRAGWVADLLDLWLRTASPNWSPSTTREHRSIVNHHLKPLLGHLPVNKVTTDAIDDMYRHLLVGGVDGKRLATATVARIHGVLHRAFAQAVRWEWVWFNPVSQASPPRVSPAEITPPPVEDVVALLASVETANPSLHAYLRMAVSTGARRSQLLGLRWAEVDFEHSAIGFARAWVEGIDGPVLRSTKTHRCYSVSIDAATRAILVMHWKNAAARAQLCERTLPASGFVFSDDIDGRSPWLPNHARKTFIQHRRRAGLAHFRLHDLRHFMASQMLGNGISVPTVSHRLGHARASTTLNVYAHRLPGADGAAADWLAGMLEQRSSSDPSRSAARSSLRSCVVGSHRSTYVRQQPRR